MESVKELANEIGIKRACETICVSRATYYRYLKPKESMSQKRIDSKAIGEDERMFVLNTLTPDRFMDMPVPQVYATLLDEDVYLVSIPTMYRILRSDRMVVDRRNQRRHPKYKKPELMADGINQVWTYDITYLKTSIKGKHYFLYSMIDIYSRYVVAWMVSDEQTSQLSERLIRETCEKYSINKNELIIHSDNGSQMKARDVSLLLESLGVKESHSRPHVSNDNAFIESHFKTLKYSPTFPERFESLEQTQDFIRGFYKWYNKTFYHSGICLLTPHQVHFGEADEVIAKRQKTLERAFEKHPERFVKEKVSHPALPKAVYINPPVLNIKEVDMQLNLFLKSVSFLLTITVIEINVRVFTFKSK